jgi:hypothetical protein
MKKQKLFTIKIIAKENPIRDDIKSDGNRFQTVVYPIIAEIFPSTTHYKLLFFLKN